MLMKYTDQFNFEHQSTVLKKNQLSSIKLRKNTMKGIGNHFIRQ